MTSLALLTLITAATLAAGAPGSRTVDRARMLMGTVCTARVETADSARAIGAIGRAFDEIARLERVMSSWRDDSELARLNATGTERFECSSDLHAALDSSRVYAALTGGAFDPTVDPLERAWDLRGHGRVPTDRELDDARARVGWSGLVLEPGGRGARFARDGMSVDLGGIGKGLALDRAADRLRENGVDRGLLNFGGETLALGADWDVAVADPSARLTPAVRLRVSAGAVSTSGQSERGVVVRGRRYGHIVDPRDGRPVERAGSVTVVAPSATRADALSTALLVMGRERAGEFAARHPEVGVLWLEPKGATMRAWKWNLPRCAAERTIEWMN